MKYIQTSYGNLPRRDMYLDLISKDIIGYVGAIVFCILLLRIPKIDFPLDKTFFPIYQKVRKDCCYFLRLVAQISGLDVRLGLNEMSYCLEDFENLKTSENFDHSFVTALIKLYFGDRDKEIIFNDLDEFQFTIFQLILIKLRNLIESLLDIRYATFQEEKIDLLMPLNSKFNDLYSVLLYLIDNESYSINLFSKVKSSIKSWCKLVEAEDNNSLILTEVKNALEMME